ncbi:MAG: hypothetical protein R6V12_18925 [Candidatus Hydrogenedentota bacterium]
MSERQRKFARKTVRQGAFLVGRLSVHRRPGVVLMLHIGRCGSTVLANMLEQHRGIRWDGQIYRYQAPENMVNGANIESWTKRQFSIAGGRYYGFEYKILPDQNSAKLGIDLLQFLAICRKIGVTHYLILRRSNTLRHIVSNYASIARGLWHAEQGKKAVAKSFQLDLDHITTEQSAGLPILSYLENVDATYDAVSDFLKNEKVLHINYETDINASGPDVAFRKVCDFLHLPSVQVEVKNQRLNPYKMEEIVENWGEVKDVLSGTKYEWMLE